MGQLPAHLLEEISTGDGDNVAYAITSMALTYPNLPFDERSYEDLKENCRRLMGIVASSDMIDNGFVIMWPIPGGVCRVNFMFSNILAGQQLSNLYVRMEAIDGPPEFRNNWASFFTNDWVLVPQVGLYLPYRPVDIQISADQVPEPPGYLEEREVEPPARRTLGQSSRAFTLAVARVFIAILFAELVLHQLVPKSVNFPALLVVTLPLVLVILFLKVLRTKTWYDGAVVLVSLGLPGVAGWQWATKANSPLILAAALCCSTGIALSWLYDRAPEQRKPSTKLWWGVAGFYLVQLALIVAASR